MKITRNNVHGKFALYTRAGFFSTFFRSFMQTSTRINSINCNGMCRKTETDCTFLKYIIQKTF